MSTTKAKETIEQEQVEGKEKAKESKENH